MRYPEYNTRSRDTLMQSYFGGYDHRERISDGDFYEMENMGSASYPLLSPRRRRSGKVGYIFNSVRGGFSAFTPYGEIYGVMRGEDTGRTNLFVYYADGHDFVTSYGTDDHGGESRQFVNMGADVIMFPDKLRLRFTEGVSSLALTVDSLENETVTTSRLPDGWEGNVGYWYVVPAKVSDTDGDGIDIDETTWASTEPPENPVNGQWWLDNSNTMNDPYGRGVGIVKRFSAVQGTWVDVYPTYVKIRFPGIGKGFKAGDFVNISQDSGASGAIKSLFGEHEITVCDDDYIVVSGSVANTEHLSAMISAFEGIKVTRSVPDLDYITEAGNRLWGCRNAYVDGKTINEIYVSALGDPTNWSKYDGITSDSYAVTVGMGGAFTGAATYSDIPHFFKESCIIKVYGNAPSNYETVTVRCDGIEDGSFRSIVNVGGVLLYKSQRGIMSYDGGYPSLISEAFGHVRYKNAVGGEYDGRYYVSLEDDGGAKHLFVYDLSLGLWHREDSTDVKLFIRTSSKLMMITESAIFVTVPEAETPEADFEWSAVTGELDLDDPDYKYISRVRIRARIPEGAYLEVAFSYNGSDIFNDAQRFTGGELATSFYMIRPARHDTMRMRLSGKGDVKVYSVSYEYERGSDSL